MSNTEKEIRSFELRAAAGDEFALVGYAARFNSPSKPIPSGARGSFTEILKRGCFTRVLASNPDVKCLYNHQESSILGRTKSGTLTLEQDDRGLQFRCQLDKSNSDHRNIYGLVRRGDLNECSFAFNCGDVDDDTWDLDDDGQARRTIRNVSGLYDVSVVASPAYSNTSVSARNTDAGLELFELRQRLAAQGVQITNDAEWLALRARALELENEIWK